MPTIYFYLRCGDLRSPGVTERRNGSLGIRNGDDDHDDDDDEERKTYHMSKMEGILIFRSTYRLSGTGIVDCLKVIDVGCNLKQFDLETERK